MLAHDPDGERILAACGADLPALRRALGTYLDESIEQVKRGSDNEPEATVAFRRVLQTTILHVQSAQRDEANAGDVLAAILQQPKSHAAQASCRAGRHSTGRSELHLARHHEGSGRAARRSRAGATARTPSNMQRHRRPTRSRRTAPTSQNSRARGCSTPWSDAPTNCSGRSKCSAAGVRTTRCLSATQAWAKRRWPRGWRHVCCTTMCTARSRTRRCLRSIPARSSPARGTGATSRSASRRSSRRSPRGRSRSCSSTRCTPPSAPARSPAARWISRHSSSRCSPPAICA